jgi:hypothetical protein
MAWNIKLHGDKIEKENFDFIQSRIPFYSSLWEKYIGNDGSNHLAEIKNITKEDNLIRRKISLHNYTCLESILMLKYIIESGTKVINYSDYIRTLSNHLSFQANTGRIKDNLDKITQIIPPFRNIKRNLDRFWVHRNVVLHNIKLPYSFIDNEFVTIIPDDKIIESMYHIRYDDSLNSRLILLFDYYKDSYDEIVINYNTFLASLLDKITKIMKEKGYFLSDPPMNSKSGGMMGTTYVDFIGWRPKSKF